MHEPMASATQPLHNYAPLNSQRPCWGESELAHLRFLKFYCSHVLGTSWLKYHGGTGEDQLKNDPGPLAKKCMWVSAESWKENTSLHVPETQYQETSKSPWERVGQFPQSSLAWGGHSGGGREFVRNQSICGWPSKGKLGVVSWFSSFCVEGKLLF